MAKVLDRVRKLVAEKLGVEEEKVTPKASFTEDLNADSLDLVELTMAFEEEFSQDGEPIEISDEDAEKLTTVSQAVDYLKHRGVKDT